MMCILYLYRNVPLIYNISSNRKLARESVESGVFAVPEAELELLAKFASQVTHHV